MKTLNSRSLGLVVSAAVLLTACGTSTGSNANNALEPPADLVYSDPQAVYAVGVPITPDDPSATGGFIAAFTVSPALPTGLGLDPSTGVISGTPAEAQAATSYTVTADNAAGSTTADVSIEVRPPAPPAGLSYPPAAVSYGTPGTEIAALAPSSTGGPIASYEVSPGLPAGLSLDPVNGVISGRPTAVSATAAYEVTGTNSLGSTNASLSITVTAAADVASPTEVTIAGFAFSPASVDISVGTTIKWTNQDAANHNATSTSSPAAWAAVAAFGTGGTERLTFNAAGVFPYKCSVHPSMTGSVTVTP